MLTFLSTFLFLRTRKISINLVTISYYYLRDIQRTQRGFRITFKRFVLINVSLSLDRQAAR